MVDGSGEIPSQSDEAISEQYADYLDFPYLPWIPARETIRDRIEEMTMRFYGAAPIYQNESDAILGFAAVDPVSARRNAPPIYRQHPWYVSSWTRIKGSTFDSIDAGVKGIDAENSGRGGKVFENIIEVAQDMSAISVTVDLTDRENPFYLFSRRREESERFDQCIVSPRPLCVFQ